MAYLSLVGNTCRKKLVCNLINWFGVDMNGSVLHVGVFDTVLGIVGWIFILDRLENLEKAVEENQMNHYY
jgi:uncharacterized membrane protein